MWRCPLLVAFLWAWGVETGWAELPRALWDEPSIYDDMNFPQAHDPNADFGGGD